MAINPQDITFEDGGSKGRYVYRADGTEAEMTFTRAGEGLVIIDHTGVPDALRGQGVGAALAAGVGAWVGAGEPGLRLPRRQRRDCTWHS